LPPGFPRGFKSDGDSGGWHAEKNNPVDAELPFLPERAFIDEDALGYDAGREALHRLESAGVHVVVLRAGRRVPAAQAGSASARRRGAGPAAGPAGDTQAAYQAGYQAAKRTLVISVRRTLDFQKCRPSADYQLPLVTSCPATCAYCYLQTTLGPRPYVRAYVNLDEILERAGRYATSAKAPAVTSFEAAAAGDPLAVEPLTGGLARAVLFAARHDRILLRSVSKFPMPASMLGLEHAGRTRLRWSLNTPEIIGRWETGTSPLERRIAAVVEAASAGYPVGLMIAPVFAAPGWQAQYSALLERLSADVGRIAFPPGADGRGLTFEVVTHRFTSRAKTLILQRHAAGAGLPLEEEDRTYRRGQFGYGKYVYPRETLDQVRDVFGRLVERDFPGAVLEYVV